MPIFDYTPGTSPEAPGTLSFYKQGLDPSTGFQVDTEGNILSGGVTTVFNVKTYGATGDGTTDDSEAIQDAIDAANAADGGAVYFPDGTYLVVTPLLLKTRVRLFGDVTGNGCLKTDGNDLFGNPTSFTELVEIDHLLLDVTGGHVWAGMRYARCHFHHLRILQNSADKAVMYDADIDLFTTCYFTESVVYVYGETRTVPGFYLQSTGVDLLTANVFEKLQLWQQDESDDAYMIHFVSSHATGMARDNAFRDVVFEQCNGGGILMESASGTTLDNCQCWDTTAASLKADFYSFIKNASNANGCQSTLILNCTRAGDGPDTGVQDINLDANALQTTIINFSARGTGVVPRIDLGGSASVHLFGLQASTVLSGTTGSGYVSTESAGSLVVHSGTDTNMVQVVNDLAGGNQNAPCYRAESATAGSLFWTARATGDSTAPFVSTVRGSIAWGPGNAARDVTLARGAANRLDLSTADLRIATAGRGLQIATGANSRIGTATLAAGTVTVANTSVGANTKIFLTRATTGGTVGDLSYTQINGTSFTINSTSATETSTVNWMLVEAI